MSTSAVIEKREHPGHVRKEDRKIDRVFEAPQKKVTVKTFRHKIYHKIISTVNSILLVLLLLELYKVSGLQHLWTQLLEKLI